MKDIAPAEPVVRYEYKEPGGLIHLDIKRLGRFNRVGHRITGDRTGKSNSHGIGAEALAISLAWHPRFDADPAHRWHRSALRNVCAAGQTI